MYQSICVPLQKSAQQTKTTIVATALAQAFEGELTGLRIKEVDLGRRRLERMAALLPNGRALLAESSGTNGLKEAYGDLPFNVLESVGPALSTLGTAVSDGGYELIVTSALRDSEAADSAVGALTERLIRRSHVDTYVVKDEPVEALHGEGHILVAMDGSQEAYAALVTAIELAKRLDKKIECVAVYDPYIHYTLFNGIVNVLSAEALPGLQVCGSGEASRGDHRHGAGKIYQAHLEVAVKVAEEQNFQIKPTLLDGKAFQKLLRHVTAPTRGCSSWAVSVCTPTSRWTSAPPAKTSSERSPATPSSCRSASTPQWTSRPRRRFSGHQRRRTR